MRYSVKIKNARKRLRAFFLFFLFFSFEQYNYGNCNNLITSKCLNRAEFCSFFGRIDSKENTHRTRK